jgi:hypothetical protein
MRLRVRRQHTQLEMDRPLRMTTETVVQFDREPLIDRYEMRATRIMVVGPSCVSIFRPELERQHSGIALCWSVPTLKPLSYLFLKNLRCKDFLVTFHHDVLTHSGRCLGVAPIRSLERRTGASVRISCWVLLLRRARSTSRSFRDTSHIAVIPFVWHPPVAIWVREVGEAGAVPARGVEPGCETPVPGINGSLVSNLTTPPRVAEIPVQPDA